MYKEKTGDQLSFNEYCIARYFIMRIYPLQKRQR